MQDTKTLFTRYVEIREQNFKIKSLAATTLN